MQDEIVKHTGKIYKELKNPKHNFGKKLKEVCVEILIITFAVTLSIWLHNWSENKHERQTANEFLKGLKKDLTEDIKTLEENKKTIANLDSNYTYLLGMNKFQTPDNQLSAQIHRRLYYDLISTHLNTGRYDGFRSSGKIETITNDSLKEKILVFYQQTLIHLSDIEIFVNSVQSKIMDLELDKNNRLPILTFVKTDKMQGLLSYGSENFKHNINNYDKAIEQAKEIILEIDKETVK
jgi:hypothetical protein